MDYPKSVPSVGLKDGKFIDENPVTGQVGSLISSEWGNAVTDELLNVIRAGGEEPAEAEHDQLLAAIKTIVKDNIPPEQSRTTLAQYGITDAYTKSVTYTKAEIEALLKNMSALPVGAMVPFPTGTVPAGFLEVNGSVQSAAEYPDLAAYLGTTFNTGGEAAGVFRLPESRGEFLRGWDHGRRVDAGRAIGSYELDQLQGHSHRMTYEHGSEATGAATTNADGLLQLQSDTSLGISDNNTAVRGPISDGVSGEPRAGSETRPRNLAVMWCIKAWNAPVNQGQIDIAALASFAVQATENNQGTAKVATRQQAKDGLDDRVLVTPKKMKWGFSALIEAVGYVAFPDWLGGWILQWGTFTSPSLPAAMGGTATFSLPHAYPIANFGVVATPLRAALVNGAFACYANPISLSTFSVTWDASYGTEPAGVQSAFIVSLGK